MKKFEKDLKEFKILMDKNQFADDFAEKYKDYILDYPFKDSYIVNLNDGFYRIDYQYEYSIGVMFEDIEKMTQNEIVTVLKEYEISLNKVKNIKELLNI